MTEERSTTPVPRGSPGAYQSGDIERELKAEFEPELNVVRRIGRGSMASVYLARERDLKRLVAIKVLSPRLARDESARRRFEREAQAVASLAHPNIVAVHRVGRLKDDLPYIVMQYVKGTTIADRLHAEGKVPGDVGLRIVHEVASALAAAHQKGIVHRDIRPANIIYDEESGRAMLTDFGIAAILATGDSEAATRITKTGELLGNPEYMSPEQLLGDEITDRSDIYGLGLLAFELFAGEGPYEAKSNRDVFAAHIKETPRKLSQFRDDVSPELVDLIDRCLAKESGRRPSATVVAERTAAIASGTTLGSTATRVPGGRGLLATLAERGAHIVGIFAAVGFGAIEFIDQLVGNGIMPKRIWELAVVTYVLGLPAVFVGAWFHGRKGRQKFLRVEYWLYGVLLIVWAAAATFILVR